MTPTLPIDRTDPTRAGHHPERAVGAGWDAGELVATTAPGSYGGEPTDPTLELRKEFEEKLALFLAWLAKDGDVITAGRKALFLAHAAGKTRFKTDAALAVALNITPGRMSQIRSEIGVVFPDLARCNRRQLKLKPIV